MTPSRILRRRKGAAIVMALALMATLVVILAVVTTQVVSQRHMVQQRQRQLQATWLARAGVDVAVARLLDKPAAFTEEQRELVPDATVRIVVEKTEPDLYFVTADAQVGLEGETVVRTATGNFRRTENSGTVRLEALAVKGKGIP